MSSTTIDIRKSWNTVAKKWASYTKPMFDRDSFVWGPFGPTEERIHALPKIQGKNVLIAGCGSGADVVYFASRVAKVTGLDISEEQLVLSQQSLDDAGLQAKLIRADLNRVSSVNISANSLDVIASSYVLQFVKDLPKLFRWFYRVLKPGGVLAFSIDHPVLYAHYPAKQKRQRNRDASKFFDYFKERTLTWIFNLPGKPVQAYSYHRTFQTIFQALVSAGFVLELCLEPAPEWKGINHNHAVSSLAQRIPHTLLIRVRKPL